MHYIKDRCYTYYLNKDKNETAVSWGTRKFRTISLSSFWQHIVIAGEWKDELKTRKLKNNYNNYLQ